MKVQKLLLASILALTALSIGACGNGKIEQSSTLANYDYMGADSSGGSDLHSIYDNTAWFSGKERTIQVCVEASSSYPGGSNIEQRVSVAFETWVKYFRLKTPQKFEFAGTDTFNGKESGIYPGFASKFNVRKFAEGQCLTTQSDLVFYFGVENDQVKKAKNKRPNALGFAMRTEYDQSSHSGKGFIWISDLPSIDQTRDDAVTALILHEIGHTFGSGHVRDTIMDEDLSDKIYIHGTDPEERKITLTKIDQGRELILFHREFNYTMSGRTSYDQNHPSYTDYTKIWFKKVTGRELVDHLDIRLVKNNDSLGGSATQTQLILTDAIGSVTIDLKWMRGNDSGSHESKILSQVIPQTGTNYSTISYDRIGETREWNLEFKTAKGEIVRFDLNWNTTHSWWKYFGVSPLQMTVSFDQSDSHKYENINFAPSTWL